MPSPGRFAGRVGRRRGRTDRRAAGRLRRRQDPRHLRTQADGRLPYGTWENVISAVSGAQGIFEEEFRTSIGHPTNLTLWNFQRLVLAPGDIHFGQWHETPGIGAAAVAPRPGYRHRPRASRRVWPPDNAPKRTRDDQPEAAAIRREDSNDKGIDNV